MKKLLVLAVLLLTSCDYQLVLAIHPMATAGLPASTSTARATNAPAVEVTPSITSTAVVFNPFVTVTAVEALNLRAAAGIHAHILTQLPSGTSLVVVGNCRYQDGSWWVNVMAGKVGGWVNQTYISAEVCP
jgi:acid phosphatase family membrane protein YuiD